MSLLLCLLCGNFMLPTAEAQLPPQSFAAQSLSTREPPPRSPDHLPPPPLPGTFNDTFLDQSWKALMSEFQRLSDQEGDLLVTARTRLKASVEQGLSESDITAARGAVARVATNRMKQRNLEGRMRALVSRSSLNASQSDQERLQAELDAVSSHICRTEMNLTDLLQRLLANVDRRFGNLRPQNR